ncbi:hypothetical protein GCM10009557_45160 [Virgisporangium ochraceum]|uniref:Nudix hydrolase domain-containing protein n=1 Tax=Virgisporangium ochraceum TaxID=65505 RepID=A0A8J4EEW8_9ACTN|nr:NUDIX domain-containing protein [Virgisporangium ochraceum]GIJ72204.1 hypothetical protein Voc01_071210 [Virgisporangium ochraceum]
MDDDARWAARFPGLFEPGEVDYADCALSFTTATVPDSLVARLHLVAVTAGERVIVCRSTQGWRFLPGGTREPGESLQALAEREVLKEAGARLTGPVRIFATHVADSRAAAPYLPHLPHPRSYWAYGAAPAELVGAPTMPPDGERIVEVLALPPADASAYLAAFDPVQAAVVDLAVSMGVMGDSLRSW